MLLQTLKNQHEAGKKYNLMGKYVRHKTSVWLLRRDQEYLWHCPICTSPIIKVSGIPIMIVPGDANIDAPETMKFPFTVGCQGRSPTWGKCLMVYKFEGYVEY